MALTCVVLASNADAIAIIIAITTIIGGGGGGGEGESAAVLLPGAVIAAVFSYDQFANL